MFQRGWFWNWAILILYSDSIWTITGVIFGPCYIRTKYLYHILYALTSVFSSAWVLLNWYFRLARNNTYLYISPEFILHIIYISFELLSIVKTSRFVLPVLVIRENSTVYMEVWVSQVPWLSQVFQASRLQFEIIRDLIMLLLDS